MRIPAVLGLLCFLCTGLSATAQVRVSAQTERSNFLLYERVDLLVTVENAGESDLVLNNDEGRPWLSFIVTKHNHLPVHPERNATFKPLSLKVGESKTLRINLTPLFAFREEGNYTAEAVIDLPGDGEVISQQVPFSVLRGRMVWSQQRPVDGSQRTYSLLRFSPDSDTTELYLRVEDPSLNVVYANVGVGQIEAFIDPDVYFDPQGNIHILHLISASTYLYTRADPEGKILHQGIFKSFHEIRPRLGKMEDGSVAVSGGIEETPEMVREQLSTGQRNGGQVEKKPDAPTTTGSPIDPASSSVSSSEAAPSPISTPAPTSAPEASLPSATDAPH
jgi:hypothetical protein